MIDTIVLRLRNDMFRISDPCKFEPSAQWANHTGQPSRGMLSKQNPTKKELLAGIYKPRLTLYPHIALDGNRETILKIELSLPKLLFGNNFDELMLKDFQAITKN